MVIYRYCELEELYQILSDTKDEIAMNLCELEDCAKGDGKFEYLVDDLQDLYNNMVDVIQELNKRGERVAMPWIQIS